MCQKSLFTYKYIHQNQSDKISGMDVREKPDGHVIVSKDEQDALLKTTRSVIVKSQKHVISPAKDMDQDSEQSFIPSQHIQEHRMEVENLKWQIQYEKKLHEEMS